MAKLIPFVKVLKSCITKIDKELEKIDEILSASPILDMMNLDERMEKLIREAKRIYFLNARTSFL